MTANDLLGRTYLLAGLRVRIVRMDDHGVTFGSASKDIKLTNSFFDWNSFRKLELEEAS